MLQIRITTDLPAHSKSRRPLRQAIFSLQCTYSLINASRIRGYLVWLAQAWRYVKKCFVTGPGNRQTPTWPALDYRSPTCNRPAPDQRRCARVKPAAISALASCVGLPARQIAAINSHRCSAAMTVPSKAAGSRSNAVGNPLPHPAPAKMSAMRRY